MTDSRFIPMGRRPKRPFVIDSRPDWVQASPALITKSLARAKSRGAGGWVVLDASRRIDEPRAFVVNGREWVAWRDEAGVHLAPDECPHMGARLSNGCVHADGGVVCPWHGLRLAERHGAWSEVPVHDDGVLVWAQLCADEEPTDKPVVPARPESILFDGIVRMEADCEPEDVVANRLDPWHGAHYHPHSFARLHVMDVDVDVLTVRVSYRAFGPFVVEVDCTFEAPTARSIVMTIIDGEGVGSVVETHATPIDNGRCAVIEATLATSDRPGAQRAKLLSRWLRPVIESRAGRLWVEDVEYAERRYALRTRDEVAPASVRRLPVRQTSSARS